MKSKQASMTAESAAAQRVIHRILDRRPSLIKDKEIKSLLSSPMRNYLDWLKLMPRFSPFLYPYQTTAARQIRGQILTRQRYAEDMMNEAIARGVRQIIILGAGYESLSLRQKNLCKDIEIIEIDHPATQKTKRKRLGDRTPKNLRFIATDLNKESLAEVLSREESGISKTTPVFCIWLGVTYYLNKDAVLTSLIDMNNVFPNKSEIVLDYWTPSDGLDCFSSLLQMGIQNSFRYFEPIDTVFRTAEIKHMAISAGFEVLESMSPRKTRKRFLKSRNDGLDIPEFAWILYLRSGDITVITD